MTKSIVRRFLAGRLGKPAFIRRLKVFVAIGLLGFFVAGGMTIWAGVSIFNALTTSGANEAEATSTETKIKTLTTGAQRISFNPLGCWGKAQHLLTVQPWLERAAQENLRDLKRVCLDAETVFAKEARLSTEESIAPKEGEVI